MVTSAMTDDPINMQPLRRSRKRLRAGDLFTFQMPDARYYYGRVVSTDACLGQVADGLVLVYVFKDGQVTKGADREVAQVRNLLLPPIMTNRLGWSDGYFETVDHWPLGDGEVLPRHVFKARDREQYWDAEGRQAVPPFDVPIGRWSVASYRSIDDQVSAALGIPLAPEQ